MSARTLKGRRAHQQLALRRIELTCSPINDASRRVATRAGFTFERVLPSAIKAHAGFTMVNAARQTLVIGTQ